MGENFQADLTIYSDDLIIYSKEMAKHSSDIKSFYNKIKKNGGVFPATENFEKKYPQDIKK